jgi:hypothetical protein
MMMSQDRMMPGGEYTTDEREYDDASGQRWVLAGYSRWDGMPQYERESAEAYTARNDGPMRAAVEAEMADDPYRAHVLATGLCPLCDGPCDADPNDNSQVRCDLGHCLTYPNGLTFDNSQGME